MEPFHYALCVAAVVAAALIVVCCMALPLWAKICATTVHKVRIARIYR